MNETTTAPQPRGRRKKAKRKVPVNLTIDPSLAAQATQLAHARYSVSLSKMTSAMYAREIDSKQGLLSSTLAPH